MPWGTEPPQPAPARGPIWITYTSLFQLEYIVRADQCNNEAGGTGPGLVAKALGFYTSLSKPWGHSALIRTHVSLHSRLKLS